MRLEWSVWAQADRDAIFDTIEADNPRAAITVDIRISDRVKLLGRLPRCGRPGRVADILAEAERYALSHRAALIRTLGRLPDRLNCGPLPPDLVRVIATGNSPVPRSINQGTRARTASVA